MAYKYVNDNGLKAYTKKVKGALKDLHTPLAISTENTTESKAQNVKNIADFIAKAKAAGIADINGMAVTCLIDNDYSGVGYVYGESDFVIIGVLLKDDLADNMCFSVNTSADGGGYAMIRGLIVSDNETAKVTSDMLVQGARKPIILTLGTTEVDEETYQKLLSDDVDVVFNVSDGNLCVLTYKTEYSDSLNLTFTCFSIEGRSSVDVYIYGYEVVITKNSPHTCSINENINNDFAEFLFTEGFLSESILSPVLQEIDLRGTDAERKAKLAQFETNWKDLTGASDMMGARFVGQVYNPTEEGSISIMFIYDFATNGRYTGCAMKSDTDEKLVKYSLQTTDGSLVVTPLFSHLEPVEIFTDNSAASKQKNLANLNAYKANLEQLGVDTSKPVTIPVSCEGILGWIMFETPNYKGVATLEAAMNGVAQIGIEADGTYHIENLAFDTTAQAVKAFGAIELKASDNAANKAALTAYLKILTDALVDITNGYSVPVRITGNAQEYHGMLNIGTGALLSGIVTDVNENHHYPFNVSTADGAITFDANNYFLEKTSNEVTEMLDAIKYSYTPVPLTATTLSNKAQLEVFLSKVPNAQVMHCTYKDVYAGTLHKINGDWFGLLVKNTNNYEDALQVKLQADGTLIEGTTSLAEVNSKLDTIIG